YLCNSIHSFVAPELLVQELEKSGFTDIKVKPETFGIATLFTAKKA
ncbi:MAG: bifunctional demethylmenaquinone methyltransferase/2-methoxy-6-polyprenyl-1,4-benzoquinol methylase, partial [Verrucomicrobia bacterium]|nr:bifunctional demethylmenaquinone methyltransferase/2-methoxy-6-polyprenyl-1,4-benzoquinol methylase [Verrucomicrobiota bacterium]